MSERARRNLLHAGIAIGIFWLNAYVLREMFTREYIDQLHSIEAAYISLARYIGENWRDLTWFPLWYGGIPYQNTYPPLLHLLSALVAAVFQAAPGTAYHGTSAALYALGPVALYAFAVRLSGSVLTGFLAAVCYSVVSPSALLVRTIANDLGQAYWGRRLQDLVVWGEGPHVSGLTFFPLALLAIHVAWEKRTRATSLLAALAMAATVLTNWLAAFTLAMGVACLVATQLTKRVVIHTAGLGVLAYCLAAPWIPPSTVAIVQRNARTVGSTYHESYGKLVLMLAAAAVTVVALSLLFRKLRLPAMWQFAILFSAITSAVTLGAYWFKVQLLPQPERYHLQMEMGLCLLAAAAVAQLLARAPRPVMALVLIAIAAASVVPVRQARRTAKTYLKPIALNEHVFGRLGRWLHEKRFQERIFAPGAKTFWLNAFTDTPQFDGGFIQGLTNMQMQQGWYAINLLESQEGVVLWARAFGIQAIVASSAQSPDPYPTMQHPEKLKGLEVLWEDTTETLYRIPQRSTSLARVIPSEAVVAKFENTESIVPYVTALEDVKLPLATLRWQNRHAAVIEGNLEPGQVISLQMSHHNGWKATVNGGPRPVKPDGLGQMIVDPSCQGSCRIDLSYDGGAEMQIVRLLPWMALLALAFNIPLRPSSRDTEGQSGARSG